MNKKIKAILACMDNAIEKAETDDFRKHLTGIRREIFDFASKPGDALDILEKWESVWETSRDYHARRVTNSVIRGETPRNLDIARYQDFSSKVCKLSDVIEKVEEVIGL